MDNWRLALAALAVLPLILVVTLDLPEICARRQPADPHGHRAHQCVPAGIHLAGWAWCSSSIASEKRGRSSASAIATTWWRGEDAILAFAVFYPAVEFLSIATIALIYWSGGIRVSAAGLYARRADAFMKFAQRFFRPIQDLSEKFNILQSAMAASERIFKLLDEPLTIESAADAQLRLESPRGEIEFRNVWFSLPRRGRTRPTKTGSCATYPSALSRGQTLAIVGHTGAGKTTLISLLLRFYEIQRGQILLDGVDIRALNVQELRRQFGIVLQDPFLFTGTIESMCGWARRGSPRSDVEGALDEVGLGDFIRSLPQGVETEVNERGSTLSVGQRQLISFARALAHNPRFLILDEATSSVDTKTEMLIREALDRLLSGRTALVIAHRLSTIQHADRILVFHKGRLREQGAHQELLAQRGIYYRLYQLQYKEQELGLPEDIRDSATTLPDHPRGPLPTPQPATD